MTRHRSVFCVLLYLVVCVEVGWGDVAGAGIVISMSDNVDLNARCLRSAGADGLRFALTFLGIFGIVVVARWSHGFG